MKIRLTSKGTGTREIACAHRKRRSSGGTVVLALALLVVVAGGLGWNYHRNYTIEMQEQQQNRPYAKYSTKDLAIMAEGYRQERAAASAAVGSRRVATRERHHFGDQVDEFERVQRATRKIRDRAIDLAQLESEIEQLDTEQQRRANSASGAMVHFTRMFRI